MTLPINDKTTWFQEELKKADNDADALAYKYILEFSETVLGILDAKGIKFKNRYLAKKLGTSPAYITKLFNGKTNFTVKKMVEIAKAVDYELDIKLRSKLVAISDSSLYTIKSSTAGMSPLAKVTKNVSASVSNSFIISPEENNTAA